MTRRRLRREQLGHRRRIGREAQEEPLSEAAAEPDERVALGRYLDPVGDRLDAHRRRDLEEVPNECGGSTASLERWLVPKL